MFERTVNHVLSTTRHAVPESNEVRGVLSHLLVTDIPSAFTELIPVGWEFTSSVSFLFGIKASDCVGASSLSIEDLCVVRWEILEIVIEYFVDVLTVFVVP